MQTRETPLKLSILDFVQIYKGEDPKQSLQNITEMVKLADRLGYTRYWFTEHHNTNTLMSTSPDMLSMHAAAHTKRIRVGAGGVMLPNHSPLKVMENFTLLEGLYPGRVDLGIGRSSGTDGWTMWALLRSKELLGKNDFPEQLDNLLSFFARDFKEIHPFSHISPPGDSSLVPDMYMLGSSEGGLQFALEKGLGFVFAAHLAPQLAIPLLREYHANFKPSAFLSEPKSMLATIVITAETEEEAKYIAGPAELMWAKMSTGNTNFTLPTPEEAQNHLYTPEEKIARERNKERFVIGSVEQVTEHLHQLAKASLVNEIIVADFYPDQESRMKGHGLLAEAFGLDKKNGSTC
ncbi:LLM class flavin-dependent oxidoreductase [Psychrobacillus psychrodurans]|uniref:LLM class flavin-dependent oxidoreductase n=1 Tax=Psychrobacillus psychrodurans TaxID=126157 RepID=A0A9X3LBI3_9BACI|nr:LLM class flavin-dependent oxidoreductase [Psychrobacillus psychrodurans]MCZ8534868.1 LLM class flavin-dependent oxidoreductase [Psychrobacillus psychrodurans]